MLNRSAGDVQRVFVGVIFSQHNFTGHGPSRSEKKRPLYSLKGQFIELLFPGQSQHRVDVDQTQEVGFETTDRFEGHLGSGFIQFFHRPMHEGDGPLLMVCCFLGLPIMDAPVHHRDQAQHAAGFLECFRVSQKDTKDAKQWNQESWHPVQDLEAAEFISDVLTNEEQTSNQHGCGTERGSDCLQSRWTSHWLVTGMGKRLESTAPSAGRAESQVEGPLWRSPGSGSRQDRTP